MDICTLCLLAPGGCPRPRAWFGAPGPPSSMCLLLPSAGSVVYPLPWGGTICSYYSLSKQRDGSSQPHVLGSRPHLALRATGGWPSPAAPELMHAVCGRRDVPPAATPTHPGPGSEIARPWVRAGRVHQESCQGRYGSRSSARSPSWTLGILPELRVWEGCISRIWERGPTVPSLLAHR